MIFDSIITLGEGIGWAITKEMTLKHASLQLNLHPNPRALTYPHRKKEKTGFSVKRENIRCISTSKNMVERYGMHLTQKTTPMEVHRRCSMTVPCRHPPSMELSMFVLKTVYFCIPSGKNIL